MKYERPSYGAPVLARHHPSTASRDRDFRTDRQAQTHVAKFCFLKKFTVNA